MRSKDNMRSGGEVLVDQLVVHGVRHAFCVPGESYLAALDAFHDRPVEMTVCRHESGAAIDWIVENEASQFEVLANAKFVGGVSDQYNAKDILTAGGSGVQDTAGAGVQQRGSPQAAGAQGVPFGC